ncbi:MAG: CPBP family intramembrane glutamic endopeptidase [Chitinophagales bacterium]
MNWKQRPAHPVLLFVGSTILGWLCMLIFALLAIGITNGWNISSFSPDTFSRSLMITVQIIQMLCVFILPAIFFVMFSKNKVLSLYHLETKVNWRKYFIALFFAIVLFPILISMEYWIEQFPFPASIRIMAESQNALIEQMMKLFLDEPGFLNFIIMYCLVGIGAGLTEELFFRGLMMPVIADATKSIWVGIIVSSGFFAAMHFSIYNLLPILFIAMLLAYLYSQTQDLKLNIFIHAMFNGFQVLANYLHQIKLLPTDIDDVKTFPLIFVFPCIAIAIFLYSKLISKNENLSN